MKNRIENLLGGLAALAVSVAFCAPVAAEVVRHPLNAGAAFEHAQLYDLVQYHGATNFQSPSTIERPIGWIFQSATIDERIEMVFGLGATSFSLVHANSNGSGYENEMYPAVALVQASGSYAWGDLSNPFLKLTIGTLPYKYNADARDLGEYLFRATPYPNTVLNSPFNLVNGAQGNVTGAILSKNMLDGRWKNDLILSAVTYATPLYDFSLAYVTSFKVNSMLEVGAGANFYRLLSVDKQGTTPERNLNNIYFSRGGVDYTTVPEYYALGSPEQALADSVKNYVSGLNPAPPAGISGLNNYSFAGTMLMARFALDFRPVLGENMDLKLYGEWAMLGVKNYPIFYEKPLDRMPFMIGVNIPTMGYLDLLGVEAEYWTNPYLNSYLASTYDHSAPAPDVSPQRYSNSNVTPGDDVKEDNLKWSVTASKSVSKSVSLTGKVAADHVQVMQLMGAGFPGRSYADNIVNTGGWYYVLRAQVAF